MYWKKKKLLTILANKRQWEREFSPSATLETEIALENGDYLVIQASVDHAPTYIITE